jgi:hypothetical protein
MTQWHPRRWHLWQMVVVSMAVIIVNCAVAVDDAAVTILSLVLMAAAKTP